MNTDNVNKWLTLGANLGVLVGIVLILIELDQNAELMRAQIIQSRTDNISAKYDAQIHSDYWAEIIAKRDRAASDIEWIESLTPIEYVRTRTYFFREYDELRNQFFQYQQGYLPDLFWETAVRGQVGRMVRLMAAMQITWDEEERKDPFSSAVIQIAQEDGLAMPNSDGVWTD